MLRLKQVKQIFWALGFGLLCGCASIPSGPPPSYSDDLLKLNETLFRAMIIDQDPALFTAIAVEDFRVLAPGGVVEGKAQAIQGLRAWDVVDIKIMNPQVVRHGNIATVINRLDIDGTMQPIGRWGPLKSMRTFSWEEGEWQLVSHSLTPCLPKAVELGRC
ncbi:hypothetical protein GCM10011309_15180 [Litorimonas cladophorae]|uniref:DUF4440 domain-containing protein n=1 Tax=Litorimonas cladophorae TaxID=1220491 RepID=A0A918NGR6_9PROT|nr:nuclear transport factor 2 family protein [Litorimonas cladophorae]GGX65869.1 hypothetical protein GCM10011309_15180 [Litorimonas cladophorae]